MDRNTQPRTQYQQLIERVQPSGSTRKTAEGELDRLLQAAEERRRNDTHRVRREKPDAMQVLRQLTVSELVPVFVELVEKYSKSGIAMQMDASNLLEGGREIQFEFGLGEYRMQLHGTVTSDAIAFHEVRHAPEIEGQLVAGPMLRLKTLTAETFREFICGRLTVLLRLALKRR